MTPRVLSAILLGYALTLVIASVGVWRAVALDRSQAPSADSIVSVWERGVRTARVVVHGDPSRVLENEARVPGALRKVERIVGEAPLPAYNRLLFGAAIVPARDGIVARYRGRSAYLTPDDLQKLEAYVAVVPLAALRVELGIDVERVLAALARELETQPEELFRHGSFARFAVRGDSSYPLELSAASLTPELLRTAVLASARFLIRNQRQDGTFRYELDAMSGAELQGYNWPRHAAATYFLARAGRELGDARIRRGARLAARHLLEDATLRCGSHACVGEGTAVDLGASAMALLAYVEIIQSGRAPEFRDGARALADFLESQQRPDGEFMHVYSIQAGRAKDVQFEFYTGEAALALARLHALTGAPDEVAAAERALSFLVEQSPLFLGARYFWGSEHWTCQAMEALWERAPNPRALKFCLAWQASNRSLLMGPPESPPEYDGGSRRGPFLVPRLTPQAARLEAALATLAVARRAHVDARELAELEQQIRRALAFLLRFQFLPGPLELMPDPQALHGGFPTSPVELRVRIDNSMHAGCALLRYLGLFGSAAH